MRISIIISLILIVLKMVRKVFQCKVCGDTHERPINSKCQYINDSDNIDQDSDNNSGQMDINKQILDELKQLNGRIAKVAEKVENHDKEQVNSPKSVTSNTMTASQNDGDLILPSLCGLRQPSQLQTQVDRRLQELQAINLQGKFKSQHGGVNETIWCKREVPWPQNFILSGSNKSRTSYDSLSMSQWVSGFTTIIREESDIETKKFNVRIPGRFDGRFT